MIRIDEEDVSLWDSAYSAVINNIDMTNKPDSAVLTAYVDILVELKRRKLVAKANRVWSFYVRYMKGVKNAEKGGQIKMRNDRDIEGPTDFDDED